MAYGDKTIEFLQFLRLHGPQTRRQLEEQPFWSGIRGKIEKLVAQGRIEKVSVANPLTYPHSPAAVMAFKTGKVTFDRIPGARRVAETYDERVRRESKARAVARAIVLLEQQGYKIIAPGNAD
jgi:hypothetical protein